MIWRDKTDHFREVAKKLLPTRVQRDWCSHLPPPPDTGDKEPAGVPTDSLLNLSLDMPRQHNDFHEDGHTRRMASTAVCPDHS